MTIPRPAVDIAPGYTSWYESLKGTREGYEYERFVEAQKNRQTIVYVGARDGMLHAFDGGKFRWGGENNLPRGDNPKTTDITEYRGYFEWSGDTADTADYGTGNELWAFIPANLIPKLKNNLMGTSNQAYVDASPAIADVYVDNTWKSVVISAQGEGGDTVFCLDVTNPAAPEFMWEFTDPDLFKSKSSPAVAKIGRVLINNSSRWVAFFVSGYTPSCAGDNNDQHCYPSVFMIDIADGSVIARIFLDSATAGKGGVPSGQPAVIDYDDNGYLDRLYIGTDKGLMYKVNIPDIQGGIEDIDDCVINGDFATDGGDTVAVASQYQSIYASPTVIKGSSGNIKIFYGTGDSPYVKDGDYTSGTQYNFFAYVDSDGKGQCTTATLEWFLELPAGHRVFASAFAAAGKIYFGTSTSDTEDPCESYNPNDDDANKGRLYILNQDGTVPVELPEGSPYIETGDLRVTPVVEDEHIYFKSPTSAVGDANGGVTSIGDGQYNNDPVHVGKTEVKEVWWREVVGEE